MQNNNGFHNNTKILMANKTIKEIKDINIGDVLCGDDNTVRTVTNIEQCENGQLYSVKQSKGEEYIIGGDHILILSVVGATPYINTSKQLYVVTYYIKCENAKCKDGCSKKGIKRKRCESKNKIDVLSKLDTLLKDNLNPNYVKNNDMYQITIHDYLNICDKSIRYDHLNGFKVQYPTFVDNIYLPLDPYFLGIWLGDGDYNNAIIISVDPEIEQYLIELASKYTGIILKKHTTKAGSVTSTGVVSKQDYYKHHLCGEPGKQNPIRRQLTELKLIKNKHIPDIYVNANENDRFKLLAGLIDTDGTFYKSGTAIGYSFAQSEINKDLFFQVYNLAKSLGIRVSKVCESTFGPQGKETFKDGKTSHIYYQFNMTGENIAKIPCLIERKKVKNEHDYNFQHSFGSKLIITKLNEANKFTKINVDGNHKFLLSDCTVVRDCCNI